MAVLPLLGRACLRELRLVSTFGGPHLFSSLVELGLLLLVSLGLTRGLLRRLAVGLGLAAALFGVTLRLLLRELVLALPLLRVDPRLFGGRLRECTRLGDLALRRSLLLALQSAPLGGGWRRRVGLHHDRCGNGLRRGRRRGVHAGETRGRGRGAALERRRRRRDRLVVAQRREVRLAQPRQVARDAGGAFLQQLRRDHHN